MNDKKIPNEVTKSRKVGSVPSRAWLYLLANGRSTAAEIGDSLEVPNAKVSAALKGMTDVGNVQRYEKIRGGEVSFIQFGVTNQCTVPGGVLMSDLLAAVTINPKNPAVITKEDKTNAE